jgi:hypothetical protein
LAAFGVPDALTDPQLSLFAAGTEDSLASNNDWGNATGAAEITAAATAVGAFSFANNSRDSALIMTLDPGVYTAQVSGVSPATGVALVEVYTLPPE